MNTNQFNSHENILLVVSHICMIQGYCEKVFSDLRLGTGRYYSFQHHL